jgi:hypothetical protein
LLFSSSFSFFEGERNIGGNDGLRLLVFGRKIGPFIRSSSRAEIPLLTDPCERAG